MCAFFQAFRRQFVPAQSRPGKTMYVSVSFIYRVVHEASLFCPRTPTQMHLYPSHPSSSERFVACSRPESFKCFQTKYDSAY